MFNKKIIIIINLIFVICLSCSKRMQDIEAKIEPTEEYIVPGSNIKINFTFDVGSNEHINFNGLVFVKFYNPNNEIEFVDIHRPPQKTQDWIPGSRIKYSKFIEIPENIPDGEYKISYGIYNPNKNDEKIKIKGKLFKQGEYFAGKIKIIKVLYYKGFYDLENIAIPQNYKSFRWFSKEAILYLTNPKKDIILNLALAANPKFFSNSYQTTRIFLNGVLIDDIIFNKDGIINKNYKIKQQQLGDKKLIELKFISEKEFIPKNLGINPDIRNLSLQIFSLRFSSR